MLEWDSFRYPEGGTYLGPVDFAFNGPDRQFLSAALGFAMRGDPATPKRHRRVGPGAALEPGSGSTARSASTTATSRTSCRRRFITRAAPNNGSRYNLIYADDIDLFGVSLAKNIAGVSVGAEILVSAQHAAEQPDPRHLAGISRPKARPRARAATRTTGW